jgi:hypothetical protein
MPHSFLFNILAPFSILMRHSDELTLRNKCNQQVANSHKGKRHYRMSLDTRKCKQDDMSQENDNPSSSESDPNVVWARIKDSQVFIDPLLELTPTERRFHCTRLVLMSDTHGKHAKSCCHEETVSFTQETYQSRRDGGIQDLSAYFQEATFPQVILAAGNHDITLHPSYYHEHGYRCRPDAQPLDVQATVRPWSIVPISKILLVPFLKGGLSVYGSPGRPITIGHLVYHEESSEVRVVSNSSQLTFSLHGRRWAEGDYTMHAEHRLCRSYKRSSRIQPRLMYLDTFTKGMV